jgi:hypothetical protein
LPAAVNAAKVDASYENVILEIALPKAEEGKPKKVEVKAKRFLLACSPWSVATRRVGEKANTYQVEQTRND